MKRGLWICMVFWLMLGLCACTISRGEQYSNFIDDLDVVTRLETALQQQKGAGMSGYVAADMETLAQDLSILDTDNREMLRINENFVQTTYFLLKSREAAEKEEAAAAELAYLQAKAHFDTGIQMLYLLPTSDGGAANG